MAKWPDKINHKGITCVSDNESNEDNMARNIYRME
jgi:hypothetical protein